MTGETIAAAPPRSLAIPLLVAAAVSALLVLIGIALMMGWLESPADSNRKGALIIPGKPLPAIQSKGPRQEPLMPTYSQPAAPPPAPRDAAPAARPAPAQVAAAPATQPAVPAPPPQPAAPDPAYAPPPAYPAAPEPPRYRSPQRGPYPPDYARAPSRVPPAWDRGERDGQCRDCGTVIGVTSHPDRSEVRVRFGDGGVGTFRFRARPPFSLGDRVRLDGNRLLHD